LFVSCLAWTYLLRKWSRVRETLERENELIFTKKKLKKFHFRRYEFYFIQTAFLNERKKEKFKYYLIAFITFHSEFMNRKPITRRMENKKLMF